MLIQWTRCLDRKEFQANKFPNFLKTQKFHYMAKYWVYLQERVCGPYGPPELSRLAGYGDRTLVCPETKNGTSAVDWSRAGLIPDLAGTLAAALHSTASAEASIGGLQSALLSLDLAISKLELAVNLEEKEGRLRELAAKLRALQERLPSIDASRAGWSELATVRARMQDAMARQAQVIAEIARGMEEFKARSRRSQAHGQAPAAPPRSAFSFMDPLPAGPVYSLFRRFLAVTGKWILIALSVLMSLRYLVWRALHTLNYASDLHLAISLVLLCAEIYGFVSVLLFFLQVLAPKPVAPQPLEGPEPSVDLFVTIYNEPLDLLRHTLVACKAIDYPRDKLTMHVLDDGPREEVRELAARYGFRYLTRDGHKNAKAGNLNAALPRTSAEFIMILDVDHIPVRSFLRETLGFFKDAKVAFVQTPHHFYNPDCYQRNLILESELVHEQDLFFQVIQPGRNEANAVVFAGSSAVFRRKALEDIGGFRVDCAIEDLHTGMELQSRGWRGIFYRRILSAGLSPESFDGYLIQRERWTKGGVQLFFLDNPLIKSGLSFRQRLDYFASLLYFFHGWVRLVYLLAPLAYLLARYNPIVSGTWTLIWYFLPHYLASHFVFSLLTREYRSPFWSDVYESAASFSLSWTAFITLFKPDFFTFKVTPKGLLNIKRRLSWRHVTPHVLLAFLLVLGIINAARHFMDSSLSMDAFGLSCVWAVFNFILMACSIEVAREHPHRRHAIRLGRSYPVILHVNDAEFVGKTLNISETGALILLPEETLFPRQAMVRIVGDGDTVILECEVRHCRWLKGEGSLVGLRFHLVSDVQGEQLIRILFSAPRSWDKVQRPLRDSLRAFKDIAGSTIRRRARHNGGASISAPAEMLHSGGCISVRLEEIYPDHVLASWPDGVEPIGPFSLRLPRQGRDELLVRVEPGEFVGGTAGRWTFALKFVSPARIRIERVIGALMEAAA